MLAAPSNWPMMKRSAMPYSVCRKYEKKYGSEKYTMFFATLPVVMFLVTKIPP